jgi:hypothetical protein
MLTIPKTDQKHATVDKIDLSACKLSLKTMQLSTKDHKTDDKHARSDHKTDEKHATVD